MKKKIILVLTLVSIIIIICFVYNYYFKQIDYSFSTSAITETKVINNSKKFQLGIKKLGMENKIILSNKYLTQLRLTKYELHKIIKSKETNKYIRDYQKVEDLGIGIVTESPI